MSRSSAASSPTRCSSPPTCAATTTSSFEDFTTWRGRGAAQGGRPAPACERRDGVKFPSMFEQLRTLRCSSPPIPNLAPEESFGWDAGVEYIVRQEAFYRRRHLFQRRTTNEIDVAGFRSNSLSTCRGRARAKASRWRRGPISALGCRWAAAYTYLDATTTDGAEEIRRPPHSGRVRRQLCVRDGRGNVNVAAAIMATCRTTAPFASCRCSQSQSGDARRVLARQRCGAPTS